MEYKYMDYGEGNGLEYVTFDKEDSGLSEEGHVGWNGEEAKYDGKVHTAIKSHKHTKIEDDCKSIFGQNVLIVLCTYGHPFVLPG